MSFKIVIPARWKSERLPGKALADLGGEPLVVRCWERARQAGAEEVLVAVDDPRILDAVRHAGGEAVLTSVDCASGTDRLAEVARMRGWDDDVLVVNLQGDEPLVPPELLRTLAEALRTHPGCGMATMATPLSGPHQLLRESIVKVVLAADGRALYFSRAPIPWIRGQMDPALGDLPTDVPFLRHIGLYAYRVRTLLQLSETERSPLERAESLEQLRALHLGIGVHVTVIDDAPPHGVDTPEDLERVRSHFGEPG